LEETNEKKVECNVCLSLHRALDGIHIHVACDGGLPGVSKRKDEKLEGNERGKGLKKKKLKFGDARWDPCPCYQHWRPAGSLEVKQEFGDWTTGMLQKTVEESGCVGILEADYKKKGRE
jgi:hypothetical protein